LCVNFVVPRYYVPVAFVQQTKKRWLKRSGVAECTYAETSPRNPP
jgi:hypothetical protein